MNPARILMVEALSLQKVYESCSDFDPLGGPNFGVTMKSCVTCQFLMRIPVRGAQSQKLGCNA